MSKIRLLRKGLYFLLGLSIISSCDKNIVNTSSFPSIEAPIATATTTSISHSDSFEVVQEQQTTSVYPLIVEDIINSSNEITLESRLYDGKIHYCGETRQIFASFYREEFASSETGGIALELPSCALGPPPEDAYINLVPYVAQNLRFGQKIKYFGCGPANFLMGLRYSGINDYDIFQLYDLLHTNEAGTAFQNMVDLAREFGIYKGEDEDMSFSEIEHQINQGNLIIMNARRTDFWQESYCLTECPDFGHYLLIVGVVPSTQSIIVHDSYTGYSDGIDFNGQYLILSWGATERIYYNSDSAVPDSTYRYGLQLIVGP